MATKVKICGLTRVEDARLAVDFGAWALGLILWPQSPRACPFDAAEEIGVTLRRRVEVVGVFVNATLDEVALAADRFSLSILQLHGDEGPAYCREAARRTGCRVMKAVRVKDAATIRELEPFHTDLHLLDAHVAGRRGGTGEAFNWELAAGHSRKVPVVLSGGLNPGIVGAGIDALRPYGVDTASGTEAAPGRKDPTLVEAFFRAVAAADGKAAPAADRSAPAAERSAPAATGGTPA